MRLAGVAIAAAVIDDDDLQLDVSAGVGLNEKAPDFFLGMGVSLRW